MDPLFAKVCNTLAAIMIVLLLGMAVLLVGPRLFGATTLSVLTASMEPTLPVGSMVIVDTKVAATELEPGDIITFELGTEMVATHRLMERDDTSQYFVTKGDNNSTVDGLVSYDRLKGKVVVGIPLLGQLATTLQSAAAIPMVGGFLVVMILLIFLPEIFSKENE